MVNDPIADLLTRIRNGVLRNKKDLTVPASNKLVAIVTILKEEDLIDDFEVVSTANVQKDIIIKLKYNESGKSRINHLERVSRPGLRIYKGYREIPRVLNGLGISIISTPKGIMTGKNAKLETVGGEYLCNIW